MDSRPRRRCPQQAFSISNLTLRTPSKEIHTIDRLLRSIRLIELSTNRPARPMYRGKFLITLIALQ
jgi:hypothetical protein